MNTIQTKASEIRGRFSQQENCARPRQAISREGRERAVVTVYGSLLHVPVEMTLFTRGSQEPSHSTPCPSPPPSPYPLPVILHQLIFLLLPLHPPFILSYFVSIYFLFPSFLVPIIHFYESILFSPSLTLFPFSLVRILDFLRVYSLILSSLSLFLS